MIVTPNADTNDEERVGGFTECVFAVL